MSWLFSAGAVLLRALLMVFWACAAVGGLLTGAAIVFTLGCRLLRPKAERQQEALLRVHRFYPVSGRGRAAYLLLCLEAALAALDQDRAAWAWLLERLWSVVSETDWIRWLRETEPLLPRSVLASECGEAEEAGPAAARALYVQAGWRMLALDPLLEGLYQLVNRWDDGEAHCSEGLAAVDLAEGVLERLSIPLPNGEPLEALLARRDPFLGDPFPRPSPPAAGDSHAEPPGP